MTYLRRQKRKKRTKTWPIGSLIILVAYGLFSWMLGYWAGRASMMRKFNRIEQAVSSKPGRIREMKANIEKLRADPSAKIEGEG
jgi:hypothetical protein